MRRWVIVFLVLINVVFLYWQYQQSQVALAPQASLLEVPSDAQTLVLLSEAKDQKQLADKKPLEPTVYNEDELSSDELIARFKAGGLQSQSERAEVAKAVVAANTINNNSQVEAEPQACWQLGPFADDITAKQVAYRLKEAQLPFNQYQEKIAQASLWWVYLPSLADRNQALAMLRHLQSQKVDSFLVTKGEHKNAISLGFFSKPQTAEQQLTLHKKAGYQAKVLERKRFQKVAWFVVDPANMGKNWLRLEQSLFEIAPGIKKLKKTCKNVALANSFN